MRVISLLQPWATLWVAGVKGPETRTWPLPPPLLGQPLGVHASARLTRDALDLCLSEPFRSALLRVLFDAIDQTLLEFPSPLADSMMRRRLPEVLPLGKILGTCVVTRCVPVEDVGVIGREAERRGRATALWITETEHAFGDYTQDRGRYAWVQEAPRPLETPVPAKGKLGVWSQEGL